MSFLLIHYYYFDNKPNILHLQITMQYLKTYGLLFIIACKNKKIKATFLIRNSIAFRLTYIRHIMLV